MLTIQERISNVPETNDHYERFIGLGRIAREIAEADELILYEASILAIRDSELALLNEDLEPTVAGGDLDRIRNEALLISMSLCDVNVLRLAKEGIATSIYSSAGEIPKKRHRQLIVSAQDNLLWFVLDSLPDNFWVERYVTESLSQMTRRGEPFTLANIHQLDDEIPEMVRRNIPKYDALYLVCWMGSYLQQRLKDRSS